MMKISLLKPQKKSQKLKSNSSLKKRIKPIIIKKEKAKRLKIRLSKNRLLPKRNRLKRLNSPVAKAQTEMTQMPLWRRCWERKINNSKRRLCNLSRKKTNKSLLFKSRLKVNKIRLKRKEKPS